MQIGKGKHLKTCEDFRETMNEKQRELLMALILKYLKNKEN